MKEQEVKTGKEIVDDFFNTIETIEGVDADIAFGIASLYTRGRLTDKNVMFEVRKIRRQYGNEN
jgi:hypothetical protein